MIFRNDKIYLNILIIILLGSTVFSCASFSKKRFRKDLVNLQETTLTNLNGNYSFHPIKRFYNHTKNNPYNHIPDSLRYNNAYDFLINEDHKKELKFDALRKKENSYQISLTLESSHLLRIKVLENSKVIKDTVFAGKLKNRMFYIENRFLSCTGIPFIFGGCVNNKRRIGLTKNNNLLINAAYSNEGALLLVFGAGYNYNVSFEYHRTQ